MGDVRGPSPDPEHRTFPYVDLRGLDLLYSDWRARGSWEPSTPAGGIFLPDRDLLYSDWRARGSWKSRRGRYIMLEWDQLYSDWSASRVLEATHAGGGTYLEYDRPFCGLGKQLQGPVFPAQSGSDLRYQRENIRAKRAPPFNSTNSVPY